MVRTAAAAGDYMICPLKVWSMLESFRAQFADIFSQRQYGTIIVTLDRHNRG